MSRTDVRGGASRRDRPGLERGPVDALGPGGPRRGGARMRAIASVRRGADLASLMLTAVDGRVLHVDVYGLGEDEQRRNCGELIAWLVASGIPLVNAEG